MCFGIGVTATMVALGLGGAALTWRRGEPAASPLTLAFFAGMEGLQLAGYLVIDQCGSPANCTVTALSMGHILIQPIVISAFMLALARPEATAALRRWVLGLSALASAVMVVQMLPLPGLGTCLPGQPLCAAELCTVSGTWHLGWQVPYNGLLSGAEAALGTNFGFPTYMLAVFVMPFFYGAGRFALLHLAVGPVAANLLTRNPHEVPAVWCLFSVAILLVVLVPALRRLVAPPGQPFAGVT